MVIKKLLIKFTIIAASANFQFIIARISEFYQQFFNSYTHYGVIFCDINYTKLIITARDM